MPKYVHLKKQEGRRVRVGHPWIFSNEIDIAASPLKTFAAGEEVVVKAADNRLLGSAYINPHTLIAVRLFSSNPETHLDLPFLQQQIQSAFTFRSQVFPQPFYRLIFSEADQLPGVVIDRFGEHYVIQINTAGMEQKKELITTALLEVLPDTKSILLRNDTPVREHEKLSLYVEAAYGQPPEEVIIEENNTQFYVPLWKGQKTGWFYDHRLNRARLTDYVKDHTVLDVFSYLGAWGIQAAKWGAKKVQCIDASAFACQCIAKNAKLNDVTTRVEVICEDAFIALKSLLQAKKTFDVIILDPPAFVKKFKDRKEGLIAYQRINELAFKLLNPNGILISCSCSMHVSMEDLVELLKRSAYRSQTTVQILERGHQGPDHPIHLALPETDYLKAVFVRKVN